METFNLKQPCKDCPFIKGSSTNQTLYEGRIESIIDDLKNNRTFACHKTIDYSKEPTGKMDLRTEKFCAGAMLYVEKNNIPHQMLQVAERLGKYNPKEIKGMEEIIDNV